MPLLSSFPFIFYVDGIFEIPISPYVFFLFFIGQKKACKNETVSGFSFCRPMSLWGSLGSWQKGLSRAEPVDAIILFDQQGSVSIASLLLLKIFLIYISSFPGSTSSRRNVTVSPPATQHPNSTWHSFFLQTCHPIPIFVTFAAVPHLGQLTT